METQLTVTLSTATSVSVSKSLSIEELAAEVQEWVQAHRVVPANGQAAEAISERNIRYYRTLGLVDPPLSGGQRGFGEKHKLQLIGIRLLQAHGLPLRRIRELLFGLDERKLRELLHRGAREFGGATPATAGLDFSRPEQWNVTPLVDGFLLVSRSGEPLPRPRFEKSTTS